MRRKAAKPSAMTSTDNMITVIGDETVEPPGSYEDAKKKPGNTTGSSVSE